MIEFLNEKQRDPRLNEILYPHYNENRVMEIIRTYEKDTVLIDKGLLSKEVMTLNPINNFYQMQHTLPLLDELLFWLFFHIFSESFIMKTF